MDAGRAGSPDVPDLQPGRSERTDRRSADPPGRSGSRSACGGRKLAARSVHAAADYGPYGSGRDSAVGAALEGRGSELVRAGSPYAVAPARIVKTDGRPYRVYSPYAAWRAHGWRAPVAAPEAVPWIGQQKANRPAPVAGTIRLPPSGEAAALSHWREYLGYLPDGTPGGYPAPIVDHAEQRRVALARYEALRHP